jgi:hypothetical protein
VVLSVYTTDGGVRKLRANYDGKRGCFVATSSFDSYSAPVNVSVEFVYKTEVLVDQNEFNDIQSILANCIDEYTTSKLLVEDIFSEDLNPEELENKLQNYDFNVDAENTDDIFTLDQIYEMSEDDFNRLLSEYDSNIEELQLQLSNISNDVDMLLYYEKYAKFDIGNEKGLEITKCDGLSEDILLDRGFEKLRSTDGNYFFLLSTDNVSELVDFSQNLYIIVKGNTSLDAYSRRHAPGDAFNNIIQDINYWFDKVRNTYNDFEKAFRLQLDDKIVSKLNESLKEANKILSQATTRINMKNVKLQRLEKELEGMNSLTLEYALKQGEIENYRK